LKREQEMVAKCEIRGCEKEALKQWRFTQYVHRDLDTEDPISLCEVHAREAQEFEEMDVAGVREWLSS
jgi:hypothetical protein